MRRRLLLAVRGVLEVSVLPPTRRRRRFGASPGGVTSPFALTPLPSLPLVGARGADRPRRMGYAAPSAAELTSPCGSLRPKGAEAAETRPLPLDKSNIPSLPRRRPPAALAEVGTKVVMLPSTDLRPVRPTPLRNGAALQTARPRPSRAGPLHAEKRLARPMQFCCSLYA